MNPQLNILFICKKVPYPSTDGESIVIMNDIKALKSLGHTIHIFALNTLKHSIDTTDYSSINLWDTFQDIKIDTSVSLKSIFFSLWNRNSLHLNRFYRKKIGLLIQDIILSKSINCVLYQGLAPTLYHKTIAKHNEITQLYRIHNVEFEIWEQLSKNTNSILRKWSYNFIAKQLKKYELNSLGFIDTFIALSDSERTKFQLFYPKKTVAQIAICLEESYFKSTYQNKAPKSILIIGSLDWNPNIEGIDWFLEHVYTKIPEIPLTIAGKGTPKQNWFQPNIKIIRNFDSLEDLFSTHMLLIIPLLSGAGIRIKLLEAMNYGMPTISTTIAADGVQIDSKVLIIADNGATMYQKIMELLNQLELREHFSKEFISNYEKYYSKEIILKGWLSIL